MTITFSIYLPYWFALGLTGFALLLYIERRWPWDIPITSLLITTVLSLVLGGVFLAMAIFFHILYKISTSEVVLWDFTIADIFNKFKGRINAIKW